MLRLELAAFLLRTGRQPLDHIADECGYGSVSALSRAFSADRSCSPLQYRAQHRSR
jgi:AraC-like DNA-binding protein